MPSLFDLPGPAGLPQTTASGIHYEIESCTVREQWAPGANQTTANVRVRAADSRAWVTDMVGKAESRANPANPGTLLLSRQVPEKYPFANQWCTRAEQIDQGGNPLQTTDGPALSALNGWPLPLWCRYRVTWEGLPFQVKTDAETDTSGAFPGPGSRELFRYVSRSRRPRVREQKIPAGGWFVIPSVPPAGRLPGMTFFKNVCAADVQYTWHRVPCDLVTSAQDTLWKPLFNQFNEANWDLQLEGIAYRWPEGTLRYAGFDDSERYHDANGDWVCDVVHFFEYRQIGWNHYFDTVGNTVEVSSDGTATGTKPYQGGDMDKLFQI